MLLVARREDVREGGHADPPSRRPADLLCVVRIVELVVFAQCAKGRGKVVDQGARGERLGTVWGEARAEGDVMVDWRLLTLFNLILALLRLRFGVGVIVCEV